jgi:hypothetical protein
MDDAGPVIGQANCGQAYSRQAPLGGNEGIFLWDDLFDCRTVLYGTSWRLAEILALSRVHLQDMKRGRESFFHEPLGRPRGRSVDSIPNRVAIRRTQRSSPKGRPRCTLTRSAPNSEAP